MNFNEMKMFVFIGEPGMFWFRESDEGIDFYSTDLQEPVLFTHEEFDEVMGESVYHLFYMAAKMQNAEYGIYVINEDNGNVQITKMPIETITFDFDELSFQSPVFSVNKTDDPDSDLFLWEFSKDNPITSKSKMTKEEFQDFYNYVESLWNDESITEGEFDTFRSSLQMAIHNGMLVVLD